MVLIATLAAALVMGVTGSAQAQMLPKPQAQEVPAPPPLVWSSCYTAFECADLTVPLNYANPAQGSIQLPVLRARATDPNPTGTLIFNPGGPGLTSTDQVRRGPFSAAIMAKFNVVGWDVRGTISCIESDAFFHRYWEDSDHLPTTPAGINALLNVNREHNAGCVSTGGLLGRHADTASAVRDMESLRLAMDLDTFTFAGQSYGTFIGQRYAALYPGKLRAMVLDAPVDHSVSSTQSFLEGGAAYQAEWNRFKAWCSVTAKCELHGQDVDAAFTQVLAAARTNPVPATHPITSQRPVSDWRLTIPIQLVLVYGSVLYEWASEMIDEARKNDASLARLLYDQASGYAGGGEYWWNATRRVITCLDTGFADKVQTVPQVEELIRLAKFVSPRFGLANVAQGPIQCAGYPAPPVEPAPVDLRVTGVPTLIVSGLEDSMAPPIWANRVASLVTDGQVAVLKRSGPGHVSYPKSRCVMSRVDSFLLTRVLPNVGPIPCPTDTDLYGPEEPPHLGPSGMSISVAQRDLVRAVAQGHYGLAG